MRWWHIAELLPIEEDLFGAEKWSAAMFWSELANGHYYVVDLDDDGVVAGYAGLAVSPPDEAWVQNIAVRRDRQRLGRGRAMLEALLSRSRAPGRVDRCCWKSPSTTRRPRSSTRRTDSTASASVRATTSRATPTPW